MKKAIRILSYIALMIVTLRLVARGGTAVDLAFPYDHSGLGTKYLTAFHGAASRSDPGALALKKPDRAKDVALALLQRYGDMGDRGTARACDYLSEPAFPEVSNSLRRIASAFR